jgi:hypothetical protein
MDVNRRGWSGSERGRTFYREQQKLWVDLLSRFLPDPADVEALLQLFQGAVLVYLVTGDREQGRRALERMSKVEDSRRKSGLPVARRSEPHVSRKKNPLINKATR